LLLVFASAAIAIASYFRALNYPFIMDDIGYISWNTKLAGLHLTELWRLIVEPYNGYSEFLPLRDFSYWVDIQIFGLNPAAFRLHNMLLYLLCLPLIYGCTLKLWRYFRPLDTTNPAWVAATVTALFALHPSHAEAVVWISGRKDVLAALLSLLALWLAMSVKRKHGFSAPHAASALTALLAAMLAKATAVAVAPVIAMLWTLYWRDIPLPDRRRPLLLWPFASLLMAACLAMIFGSITTENIPMYLGVEAATRSMAVLGWLARLSLSPENRHFYHPVLEYPYLFVMVACGIAVLAAGAAGIVMVLRKRSLERYAAIAFLLLCLPSLQLIPYAPPSLVSDRFVFLAVWPMLMLLVALAWRLSAVLRTVLLLAFAISWGFQTSVRPHDWRNFETLVDADLHSYPDHYMPAVYKITSFHLPRQKYSDAEKTANNIATTEFRNLMLGMIRIHHATNADTATSGKLQEAMMMLWKLGGDLKQAPVQAKWNSPMNNLWTRMPFLLAVEWKYLVESFPEDVLVSYNAGLWMLDARRYDDAVTYLRTTTKTERLPKNLRGTAYASLGLALLNSGHIAEAEAPLREALEQSPPDLSAHCQLARIFSQAGRSEEAAQSQTACPDKKPER